LTAYLSRTRSKKSLIDNWHLALYNIRVMATEVHRVCADVSLDLIRSAAECHLMADFSTVLQTLAEIGGAQGCVLWDTVPFGPDERRFIALAEYLPGELVVYYLPWDSITGEVVRSGKTRIIDDLQREVGLRERGYCKPFLEMGVTGICSIPMTLEENRAAAVNLYRFDGAPFTGDELARIEGAAAAISYLFNSVRNEMGFRLLRGVGDLLRKRGSAALQDSLARISEAINAVESAIYLEDALEAPGVYALRAFIWPWDWEIEKRYRKDEAALTSWVIRNARTVRLLDLSHFEEEVSASGYEELVYRNKGRLEEAVRRLFQKDVLPPLSFVCVPVKHHGKTIGAMRFCVNKARTRFFDDRHVEILELVADQIGECWGAELDYRRGAEEKRRFQLLTKGADRLNVRAFHELNRHDGPSLDRQLQAALEPLAEISGSGEALSIRLVDSSRRELRPGVFHGRRWCENGKEREFLDRRIPLTANYGCCESVRDKRVVRAERTRDTDPPISNMFPDTRRTLHTPILVGDDPVGVIDIRGFGDQPFPPLLDLIAGLIASQLGLHHHMFEQFRNIQQTNARLQKAYDEQSRILDDFHHQITNPVVKTATYAKKLPTADADIINALRGNARKAEQVARHMQYFIALAKDAPIKADEQFMTPAQLLERLSEMANDEQAVNDPARKLQFFVNETSFKALAEVKVRGNMELLEHAAMNLLDNAGKYSDLNTNVTVRASLSQKHFRISVTNRGIPISRDDRKHLVERGVRGDQAMSIVAHGRGLGLYIAEKLMQAMGGDLEIIPTDSGGLNEFRLLLRFL